MDRKLSDARHYRRSAGPDDRPPSRRTSQGVEGGERKVRTPQGSAPGNARSGQLEGKWHRKYTATAGRKACRAVARKGEGG